MKILSNFTSFYFQIDYPEGQTLQQSRRVNMDRGVNLVFDENFSQSRPELYQKSNRSSHSSDTSSAYSGSDTMTSVQSSLEADEVDLSGLVESIVDSDEEDLAESIDVSFHSLEYVCSTLLFQGQTVCFNHLFAF